MTLREILSWGTNSLVESNIDDAKVDAWYLLEHIVGLSRTDFYMNPDKIVDSGAERRYRQCISKRKKHCPLQYITNCQQFMGYDFFVDESVLVPRFETEQLVVEAEKYLNTISNSYVSVLDMCTGSGCIAISLKLRNESFDITAVDISDAALKTSKINAKRLGADICFIKSDLFNDLENHKYDIIISNPPYIETGELESLMEEVKNYEPLSALDGREDGLFYYCRIIDDSKRYLKSNGKIYFEIGYNQGGAVADLLECAGFTDIEVIKDLSGLDRIVSGGISTTGVYHNV